MAVNDIAYWVWYAHLKGVSSGVKLKFLEEAESPKEIFCAPRAFLKKLGVTSNIIQKVEQGADAQQLEMYVNLLSRHEDIEAVTYFDHRYPRMLLNIANPPLVLYYKGNISLANTRCIAMVGTRNPTNVGKYHARSFAMELAGCGYTVVSGMAKGIDSAAHIGALSMGNTIAVLGCGVDVVYPADNKELYNKICQRGLVISEFMPEMSPQRWSFPIRNRIISGLSESTLLVEAPEKSGAMNTVTHAVEQNRDVYVLHNDGTEAEFSGNRKLIAQGAAAVRNPYDIINNGEFTAYDAQMEEITGYSGSYNSDMDEPATKHKTKTVELKEDNSSTPAASQRDTSSLNSEEKLVYDLISRGTRHFDDIVNLSGMGISDVGFALTMLEFNEFITQKPGKFYELI